MVWKTGLIQQVVMVITFVAALLIPLQYAVLMGVALAILLFVIQQSNKITVVEWKWEPGQLPVESAPPEVVPSNSVTVLIPYGSLFFAAAPVFEEQLPEITEETRRAVIIIAMRDKSEVGSTLLEVFARYAKSLHEQDSKLMLAGVDPHVRNQIRRTKTMQTIGRENVFLATETVGESALEAIHAAEKWIGPALEKKDAQGLSM